MEMGPKLEAFALLIDLIEGFIRVMEGDYCGPVNIGNPNEILIGELALKLKNKINKNLNIIYKKLPNDDPLKRKPSIEIAKSNYDWQPRVRVELDYGLDQTINYFKKFFHRTFFARIKVKKDMNNDPNKKRIYIPLSEDPKQIAITVKS